MKKVILLCLFVIFTHQIFAQSQFVFGTETMTLLFTGDIMGHGSQIRAAHDAENNSYHYNDVFEKVTPLFDKADFTIANLEVTLGGKPYTGYPLFSSPDALAQSCKDSGIDVLVTANNHSCDRGKSGLIRTLDVLDSLDIPHTGTFRDSIEREQNNLLVLQKNNIKVGVLNYTYGTNGLPVKSPTVVNLIDTLLIAQDIQEAKTRFLDKLIVMIHWGAEYQSKPSKEQLKIADFIFEQGADIIIGSHPHVIQPMAYYPPTFQNDERLVAYSLGNFISNQRTRKNDGGAMMQLTLSKTGMDTSISDWGYHLVWVNKPIRNWRKRFQIVPCLDYELTGYKGMRTSMIKQMSVFINDSRELLNKENLNVDEIGYEKLYKIPFW